jgi:hypothetical protein
LDDSIDKGRVTYIGGGVRLGLAPGRAVTPGEAAPRAGAQGGWRHQGWRTPCLTLMGLWHLYKIGSAGPTFPIQSILYTQTNS